MLRLTPPDREVLFQTNNLVATFGGAEANVAVSLANYGENISYVTAAPANPVGDAMVKEMRSFGIDTKFILRKGERLGVYYTETGAAMRPSKVVYDRAGSSIASIQPGDFDWDAILDGATWFHTTGITPSLAQGGGRKGMPGKGNNRLVRPELPEKTLEVGKKRKGSDDRVRKVC